MSYYSSVQTCNRASECGSTYEITQTQKKNRDSNTFQKSAYQAHPRPQQTLILPRHGPLDGIAEDDQVIY